jgi:hypothetical protein
MLSHGQHARADPRPTRILASAVIDASSDITSTTAAASRGRNTQPEQRRCEQTGLGPEIAGDALAPGHGVADRKNGTGSETKLKLAPSAKRPVFVVPARSQ